MNDSGEGIDYCRCGYKFDHYFVKGETLPDCIICPICGEEYKVSGWIFDEKEGQPNNLNLDEDSRVNCPHCGRFIGKRRASLLLKGIRVTCLSCSKYITKAKL